MPCADSIKRLPYADALVQEALRLKPPIVQLGLSALQDQVVGDVEVPAGTRLVLLTRHSWMQARCVGGRTSQFIPDRWLASSCAAPSLPFGAGARMCPGRHLAMTQIKTLLVGMALRLNLQPDTSPMPEERLAVSIRPESLDLQWKARP